LKSKLKKKLVYSKFFYLFLFIFILFILIFTINKVTNLPIQKSPLTLNPQGTIDTSIGTHLWLMDDCSHRDPQRGAPLYLPADFSYDFIANNFDVFVIGDWSNGLGYREPIVEGYISQIKQIKSDAKFVYYSDFQQFLWEETTLNEMEDSFLHSTDPAALNLIANGNNVIIDWNDDTREKYRGEGEPIFRVSSYNIYRNNNPIPIQNRPYGATQITDNPGIGLHEYEIKTKRDSGQEYSYSWKKSVNVDNTMPSFYLTDGYVEVTENSPNYNLVFHLKPNIPDTSGLDGVLYIDLDPQNYALDFGNIPNEINQMTWNGNEYVLTLNNIPMNPRSPGSSGKFGYVFYFELKNNNIAVARLPKANNEYYTTNVNNRIKAIAYGTYQQNIASLSWRNFYVQHAIDILNNLQPYLDGVYVDEPTSDLNTRGETIPKDPNVNVATYNSNNIQFMQQLRNTIGPNKLIFHNTLTEVNLQPDADGGLIEGYVYDTNMPGGYLLLQTWIFHMNKMLEAENGGLSFALPEGFQNNWQLRMYMLASYLLTKKDGSYLNIYEWGCPSPSTHIFPEWDNTKVGLGQAIDNPNLISELNYGSTDLYIRRYQNGLVVVNPTNSTKSLNLGGLYKEVVLNGAGNDIILVDVAWPLTMQGNSGKILIAQVCSDGTPYGYCSVNQPLFCNTNGQLINNCQQCRCSSQQNCQPDGSCQAINLPPTATITQPTQTIFTVNTPINYAGTGTDPEDGNLLASSLCWSYDIIGDTQGYFDLSCTSSGTFTPSILINNQPTIYTLKLTVIDSGLLTDEDTKDLTITPSCSDIDGDGYGNPGSIQCPNGSQIDCNDNNININPSVIENNSIRCSDNIDNDCDNLIDLNDPDCVNQCIDNDRDNYGSGLLCLGPDCDDNNINVHSNITCNYNGNSCGNYQLCLLTCPVPPNEICGNNIDDNCNGPIDEGCTQQLQLSLQQGYNFISVPFELTNNNINDVFVGILNDLSRIYSFDSNWFVYRVNPNPPSTLNSVESLKGYIIILNNPTSVTISGTIDINKQRNLNQGWNLISINSLTQIQINTALQGLDYTSIWKFDNNLQDYIQLNPSIDSLEPGKAYWIYLNNPGIFNP